MDLAFRMKFKYICIILHDYCVIIGVVVVPREASSSSPSIGAFGRFRALRALSRGALSSSQALSSPPPPPASPSSPPSSSSFSAPPPRPLSSALAGSQARVSRQGGVAATGGAQGAGRGSPHLGEAPRSALLQGRAARGPERARGGESRLAPPLSALPKVAVPPRAG